MKKHLKSTRLDFEAGATILGDERDPDGSRLSDGILLSLKYLEVEFSKWKERISEDIAHTISDLYLSLCVLTKQVWVPISVLSRLWNLDEALAFYVADLFCGMSLATLSFRKIGDDMTRKAGLSLHDLHLEFSQQQAKAKKLESKWHAALLHKYLKPSSYALCSDPYTLSPMHLVKVVPRPWWSNAILDDGYIHTHLARHLSSSGGGSELTALLLDARWMNVRG